MSHSLVLNPADFEALLDAVSDMVSCAAVFDAVASEVRRSTIDVSVRLVPGYITLCLTPLQAKAFDRAHHDLGTAAYALDAAFDRVAG